MSAKQISAVVAIAALGMVTAESAASRQRSPVIKGGSYKGGLAAPRTSFVITFKVSRSGKQVTNLRISNLPFYCAGGGKPVPISFKNAKISKRFTFTSTGVQTIKVGPRKGQKGATLTITGKFTSGRAESGAVTTNFGASIPASCDGTSRYSTKAT